MNRQFLFIKSATESIALPVDSFSHAEYTSDTTVSSYFNAIRSGKDASVKVVLTVSSGKANDVVSAITSQVAAGNAPVIKMDDVTNVFHIKNVTGITSITTTESPSITTGPTGATGPTGPTGAAGAAGAAGSNATGLGGTDQTLSASRLINQNGENLELDVNGGEFMVDDLTHRYMLATSGELTLQGLQFPTSDGTSGQFIKTNGSGVLSFGTVNVSTLTQVYSQSFFDDISTLKHYLPFKDINEQSQVYQEEAAMLMPFDGRIRSVSIKGSQVGTGGNFTVGIETLPVGDSIFTTSNWNSQETEVLAFGAADSNHVFHFVFDNAKHFDAGESCSISLQADADPGSNTYWHVTTVVDFDTSVSLGTSSTEHETTP